MANKRNLKRNINIVCEELLAECVAASLYGNNIDKENADAIIFSIIKLGNSFIHRVSHPEPGMTPKAYFKDLIEKFNTDVEGLTEQINNLY